MENSRIKGKVKIYPFLIGGFVGGVLGQITGRYIYQEVGDEPGMMIGSGLMFIAAIIAGGLGGMLLQELRRKVKGEVFHPIGFSISLGLFIILIWFCYTVITSAMDFRGRLRNYSAIYALRNYREEIFSFYSTQRRLPKSLEEIDKYSGTPIAGPTVHVEYVVVSNSKNGFMLQTYHRKGDREYQQKPMSTVIVSKKMGTSTWEPLLDRWGQPMEWNK